ncbi:dynein axonemal heavy chain 3 [Anthonomus grandis grandis]|uniref:dynein axonemal heavy chain 3 n=1 Tax=Anthonomus grandis grandis TaxID=2921223 RepID=UPI00216620DB|nr:dynein axonemal heavy chain 3 [Anthonomus grandis grandis]
MQKPINTKYGRRIVPIPPWIPIGDENVQSPVDIQSIKDSVEYPPLFTKKSWTQGVPEKDTQMYFRPSETIGSAFTPQAQYLRIQDLPTKKRKERPSPLGTDGKLQYPPKKSRKEQEQDKIKQQLTAQKKKLKVPGIIDIEYLLSGQWHRDKQAQAEKKEKEKAMKKKVDIMKWEGFPDERGKLAQLQAILPKDPDEQKEYLYSTIKKDMVPINKSDIERIVYYLTEGIDPKDIPPYNKDLLDRAKRKVPEKYKTLKCFKPMIQSHECEVLKWYCIYMRYNMLFYVLHDPSEWKRLRIESCPKFFPVLVVRAPVTWHTPFCISKQYLERYYFIGNIVVRRIRELWFKKYDSMLILPVERLCDELSQFPLEPNVFKDKVNEICAQSRGVLVNEWLPECADIFLEFKSYWKQYIPRRTLESSNIADRFFSCVNMLLSNQLRSLVMRSLVHFKELIINFKGGNDYGSEYADLALINLSILTVKVLPNVGTDALILEPPLEDIQNILQSCINAILSVNMEIFRIENLMFPELQTKLSYLYPVREDEEPVVKILEEIQDAFNANLLGPEKYLRMYRQYFYILNGSAERELTEFFGTQPFPYLKDFSRKIYKYEELKNEIIELRRSIPLNMFLLDCGDLNEILYKIIDGLRTRIVDYFIEENHTLNRGICDTFDEMSQKVSGTPETVAELVELQNYVAECRDVTMYNLKEQIRKTAENVSFLMQHAHLTAEDINLNCRVFLWPKDMESVIDLANQRLNMKREQAEQALRNKRTAFDAKLKRHEKLLVNFKKKDPPILTVEEMEDSVQQVEQIVERLQEDKAEAEQINEEEQLLDIDPSPFMNLAKMLTVVEPYDKLWHSVLEFHENYDLWYYGPFAELDADEITDYVENMWRTLYKLAKTLGDNPGAKRIAEMVRAKVEKFRQFLPVLQTVCNKGLQQRHWDKISEIVGMTLVIRPDSTLNDMIEAGLPKYSQQLEEVGAAATKEYTLEKNLMKMKEEWVDIKFECVPYRETGVNILSAVDDIQVMMDDHILKAQTMRGSPYVKAFEAAMQSWEEKLISMQDILEQWLQCQATWMYLEPIFSSEDIMRQMPTEARHFKTVDRVWRAIQAHTIKDTHVLVATEYKNMLALLKENNRLLDEIQKGLNDYLEKKRLFFPRFFFLSNDELLEILSETKDPLRVQPHLKKCFEGIYALDFNKDEEVIGMVSAEKEKVTMSTKIVPADAKGMVEKWLIQVESVMIQSLKDFTKRAIDHYPSVERPTWILTWPGQIVQCVDCIEWTSEVTGAIFSGNLLDQEELCTEQIEQSVKMVQGTLKPNNQVTVEALIVIDVHGRDIVTKLKELNVTSIADFNWISQLRYYWRSDAVSVCMITTEVLYGFEYLGNTGRLVATPLTDRCYRTLMGALKLNLGGAPEGPAGTGKTETCKDLAKAVAKKCVVFNCSDGLDYKALGKFFKGLAQAGAWACFDEFNRIELEVLSVVAQQILSIQMAVAAKLTKFVFEGTEITLDPTCTVFITMNPGYAGRQELPDNLKVLFRTVAMMVPDYAMIGAISLYSYGFVQAQSLAEKIVHTYKLCSEQLSSQNHYDYGMRAVKSVLLAAGALRRLYPATEEAQLVLRAIIDVNLPKFLAQDVPLFIGIYQDLFPNIEVPAFERSDLIECLIIDIKLKNLQPTPWFVEKCMQIYEMILVRHGLMIVGKPMGGKTSAYQSLADALGRLCGMQDAKLYEHSVQYRIINPKAISMGQLYGQFDPASHEWSDGVLANTFREFANSYTLERKWILFDGPVDAVWIENMNTVLDDNKKLCLMSGEIIQMSPQMNLIFEPADLEQASPATVSRCGMIYMEPHLLGWRPLMDSYVATLEKILLPEQIEILVECVEWLVPPCLEFINENCRKFVETSDVHLFYSFTRLFKCLLVEENQVSTVWMQCVFLFCLAWGLGSTLTNEGRKSFDVFYRKILEGQNKNYPKPKSYKLSKNQIFPERADIFDWLYDKKNNGTWISWSDTVDKVQQIPPTAKANELIIQTNASCCQRYFLKLCLTNCIPILFVGPTGTGKTAVTLDHLLSLPKEKVLPNVVNFSARTTSSMTQEMVMSKLDKRRRGVFGPSMGKKCVLFVDDVGMPQKETWGAQPPVELLRQWLDHGHWFDKDTSILMLVDVLFVGAMGVPGGGRNEITDRFLRHMQIIGIDAFDDNTLNKIFSTIIDWHFAKGYVEVVQRMAKFSVGATNEVFKEATMKFLPTPAKSHYTFSLRDFSRVVNGLLITPPSKMDDQNKFIRLWIHETYRVFHDRLIDDGDRETLFKIVFNACYQNFRQPMDKACEPLVPEEEKLGPQHIRNLFFGNYIEPDAEPKLYDEISDMDLLIEKMEYYLSEYNMLSKSPMNLVMFKFAIEHVSRVSRVLNQPNGNVLLVGIGGSGRHSSVKLASAMSEFGVFEIELSRNYGVPEWREDLKTLMLRAGCDGKPIVFLFADTQVADEMLVEDISTVLNTADVPNLYAPDEKADILEKMQTAARESGKKVESTPLALYNFFIERIRQNLHVALCFSPIGDAFRVRCRMFPSLINCCTIDWFQNWPDDALERVAHMFLCKTDIGQEMIEKCVAMCKEFHVTVQDSASLFYREQKRKTYVTPTSYLELIQTFITLYGRKVDQIKLQINRYLTGLEKLGFAAGQVGLMQQELHDLQPKLIVASAKTEKLMIKIEQDTVIVEKQKEVVAADEALANEAAAAAQAIKDDCESDLSEAIPALEAAVEALDTLKPADITLVKSMKNPPSGVKLVMEAVCVMRQQKPERKPDMTTGKMVEDFWGPSVKLLGDMKFLEHLKAYDKDNIPVPVMKRIRERYMPDREFDPERIKTVSTACEGLCKWVRAMEVYDRVIKIVAPKKARLAEAEAELALQMDTLNEKRAQLQEVSDKLQALNDEFAAETKKKKELEDQIYICSQKLDRAEKLIESLGGEKARWSETAATLGDLLNNVIGDVLLSAGAIAYLGAFTVDYRRNLIKGWNDLSLSLGIPCSENFSLVTTMGEPVVIRSWNIAGLPVDNYSVENGIIASTARRYPLMIDPQGQANKWVKNMEKNNRLQVIKLTDANYVRVLENAITFGTPVILENINEDLDAVLDPILSKNIFKQQGVWYLKLADNVLEYSFDFRFFITTRLRNPHYLPEIAVKVSLLNFMITPQGLQDQLLGIVVAREKPELEEKKNAMIVESANNKKMLKEIEDKILEVLSTSEGNILEDETAIKILSSSKVLSADIEEKQKQAAKTEVEIDFARNQYVPVSKHSSILFFCISDLANIEPMYQYSLGWFINLYNQAITNSPQSTVLEERLGYLSNYFTNSIYRNVCRSLFEKDKLIFSFVLTVGILRSQGLIDEDVWGFLITGGVALDNPYKNPAPEWLSEKSWSEIVRASLLTGLAGLRESVQTDTSKWKEFYDFSQPNTIPCPEPFETLKGLQRLVALRCLRPDKIVPAVQNYIVEEMGQAYLEPPQFNLEESYNDSNCCSPLIFILSPGSDPMAGLIKFAADMGIHKTSLMTISLGQGQGPIAANMITTGLQTGQWAVLQNCHLAASWMRELDRICDEVIVPEVTNPNFRLWLTSYPSTCFPVAILQNGVKMTNEAPKGLRQNLLRSYQSDPISNPEFYASCQNVKPFQCLLFALCFFHGLVQERRKFGPLGWNIPYEFNESDLRISVVQLQMFLNDYVDVPYEALTYLTGECNYGGRVTDDKDRRLLNSLLSIFYVPQTVKTPFYPFSPSGNYYVPKDTSYEGIISYIKSLPINPEPEVFGLHENADITKDNQETQILLYGVLLTQTQLTEGGGGEDGQEKMVIDLAQDILNKVPDIFNVEEVSKKYPVVYDNSMNTVLRQELIRFNRLIAVVKRTLKEMIKAVAGLVVMSSELEETCQSLMIGKVPSAWASKSYPSLKPLGSYVTDLIIRLKFFQDWIDKGAPLVFWLSGFFFTQSFLTGVLQNYGRRMHFPIDWIHFEYYTTKYETEVDKPSDIGVFCKGLFLEGARWDRKSQMLAESLPKILFDVVPIMWLKPAQKDLYNPPPCYNCPVYKTTARRGVLSTTGHSTNFVMYTTFASNLPEKHWINRGVASLCQLDD